MRKLIAGINMTLDGYCDHTAIIPDDAIHQHYTDLLNSVNTLLYGRITYLLMEDHWPGLIKNPSGIKHMDDFAQAIDGVTKIVFSRTMKKVNWSSAKLATGGLKEEIIQLKQQDGRDILVGSRSLIIACLNLDLVDELQLMVHPVIAGKGLPLFDQVENRIELKLLNTKRFSHSGSMLFYYQPISK